MLENHARVLRFEQRGCGRSSATPPYDLPTTLSDLDALRTHFGIDRWTIGGHSWGADLALAYALTYPERTKAVLHLNGTGVQNDRSWKETYERGKSEGREPMPEFDYPPNMDVNAAVMASWREFIRRPDLLRRISDLPMPLLAVYGSEDIRPSWPVEQLCQLVPNGRFVLLQGAGHMLWETHADDLASVLQDFVW
jgi:proline iminopeptidase